MTHGESLPITIRQVTKAYDRLLALDRIDLDIRSGEFLTLLGPSGSGKSTLLMVLAGFVRPDCGSISFGKKDVTRIPPNKRGVGMVFQNYALFPHMSVAANVAFPLRLRSIGKAEARRRVERALELVRLGGYGSRRIDQLSGGQRQRVALARAIVFEPHILLMDEPLSALDKQLREYMQIELRELHMKLGMTTVYVTHDQREALTMSDRIAVINHGRVMQLDTPREIYERPTNKFVASFIGESTFVTVEVSGGRAFFAGMPLRTPAPPRADGKPLLLLRPERLRLLDGAGGPDMNRLAGRIVDIVYQGDSILLHVVLAEGTRVAIRSTSRAEVPAAGSEVTVGLSREDTLLLSEEGR